MDNSVVFDENYNQEFIGTKTLDKTRRVEHQAGNLAKYNDDGVPTLFTKMMADKSVCEEIAPA